MGDKRWVVVASGSWVAGTFDSEGEARERAALYGGEAAVYHLVPLAPSVFGMVDFIGLAQRLGRPL